jgi:hypothetical protein
MTDTGYSILDAGFRISLIQDPVSRNNEKAVRVHPHGLVIRQPWVLPTA